MREINIKKAILFLITSLFFIFSCSIKNNYNSPVVKKFILSTQDEYPISPTEAGKIITTDIGYFYKDEILWEVSGTTYIRNSGDSIAEIPTRDFLFYKKKSKYGQLHISNTFQKITKKVLIDSIIWTPKYLIELELEKNPDVIKIESKNLTTNEKYAFKNIKIKSNPDSIYINYSQKMENLNFSFCEKFDSLKKQKVSKFVIVFNSQIYPEPGGESKYPKRVFYTSFEEDTIQNPSKILAKFKQFEKDWGVLK